MRIVPSALQSVTIELDPTAKTLLEIVAEREGVTLSELASMLLREHLIDFLAQRGPPLELEDCDA